MFKSDTLAKISTLSIGDIIKIVEQSYSTYAEDYYKYLLQAREVESAHVPDVVPSTTRLAPHQMERNEVRDRALRAAKHAYRMCEVLELVLRDLNTFENEKAAQDIVDYFRSRT